MMREASERLIDFCVGQSRGFAADDWVAAGWLSPRLRGVAALFLSSTRWYGHGAELRAVAERLQPGISRPERFEAAARAEHFDFARFSSMLRRRLGHA